IDDQVRVAPVAGRAVGIPLLRRHRGPSRRPERRRRAGGSREDRRLPQGAGVLPGGGAMTRAARGKRLPAGGEETADLRSVAPENVRGIAPYVPGKPIAETARELGIPESDILKMASNESPVGA